MSSSSLYFSLVKAFAVPRYQHNVTGPVSDIRILLPRPRWGTGYWFRAISLFVCLFISLSATLRENGWTDLHEIFREGVEWPWDDLIQFWVNSSKRVGGSKVKLFVITGHSSESVLFARWQQRTGVNKSVAFTRGGVCCAPHHSLLIQWRVSTMMKTIKASKGCRRFPLGRASF